MPPPRRLRVVRSTPRRSRIAPAIVAAGASFAAAASPGAGTSGLAIPAATAAASWVLVATGAARADDGPAAETFRRAELAERGLGDYARAADLYREAARLFGDADAEGRARAELRGAACLRRIGRDDEARALAEPLATGARGASADVRRAAEDELRALGAPKPQGDAAPSSADAERVAELERERDETRVALEAATGRAQTYEAEIDTLVRRLLEKDAELARRQRAAEEPDPRTAEEVLERRRRDLERRRREQESVARALVSAARLLHQDGRFADARSYLYDALERDPENAEARALLDRVSAPLGDRETLFLRTLEVVALAREVASARRAAEVASLIEEARRRQARGDFAGSSAPLERALATLDAFAEDSRARLGGRDEVLRMLQAAVVRGVPRAPAPAPPSPGPDERWLEGLRELLAGAASEASQGLQLRFHDLGPVVASGPALPPVPVGAAPEGWTLSVASSEAAPLLAAWFRAEEARALAAPGASFRLVGTTIVALCDRETQRRFADHAASLRLASPPAAEVRITTWRADRATVSEFLAQRGVSDVWAEGEGRAAVVGPSAAAALAESADASKAYGGAAFRSTSLRSFRMSAGSAGASFSLDVLPSAGPRTGVGVRAETVRGRDTAARLRAVCTSGGGFPPGGGLVVYGLADPEDPQRELAVLVRVGDAPAAPQPPPSDRLPPPVPGGRGLGELLLPPSVANLDDAPDAPQLVPEHPVATRREALLRRLREKARGASLVDVRGDRVLVVGPDDAQRGARDLVAQIGAARGLQSFEVRVHQIPLAVEERVVATAPRLAPAASGAFAWCVLRSDAERRPVELLLAAVKGELALVEPVVGAPASGRCDVARVARTWHRSGPGLPAAGGPGWGRAETAWVDEGLCLTFRPFGRSADGRLDFDFAARARWISERGEHRVETPLGPVRVLDPTLSSWWGDVTVALGRGESLLIARARNPFATAGSGGDRLVVLVKPVE